MPETEINKILTDVAKLHKEWINIAKSVGCPDRYSEDVVQECYIRLHKYSDKIIDRIYLKDGSVNNYYMFVIIRNMVNDLTKNEGNYVHWEDFWHEKSDEVDYAMEEAYNKLIKEIKDEADKWGAYHSKLFSVYYFTDYTMRDIRDGTGIGLSHIHKNLNEYREIIKSEFRDKYDEFKKGNYDN